MLYEQSGKARVFCCCCCIDDPVISGMPTFWDMNDLMSGKTFWRGGRDGGGGGGVNNLVFYALSTGGRGGGMNDYMFGRPLRGIRLGMI